MKYNSTNEHFEFSKREADLLGLACTENHVKIVRPCTDAYDLAKRALELEEVADTHLHNGADRVAAYTVALATYSCASPFASGVYALEQGFNVESMRVKCNDIRPTIPGK